MKKIVSFMLTVFLTTIAEGFVYYLGQKGVIYQAPLDDPAKAKAVYQLPSGNDYSEDGFAIAGLTTVNGTAIVKYHIGGASMGTDYAVAPHPDGSYEDLPGSFSNSVKTDAATIVLASDNCSLTLEIRRNDEKAFTPLGESGYSYGTYMLTDGQTTAPMTSSDLAAVGDEAYVIATKWNESAQVVDPVGVYQVNIKTNETKRVFTETATHFKVADGCIYFTDLDGLLYKAELGLSRATKVSDIKMNAYYMTPLLPATTASLSTAGRFPSQRRMDSACRLFTMKGRWFRACRRYGKCPFATFSRPAAQRKNLDPAEHRPPFLRTCFGWISACDHS